MSDKIYYLLQYTGSYIFAAFNVLSALLLYHKLCHISSEQRTTKWKSFHKLLVRCSTLVYSQQQVANEYKQHSGEDVLHDHDDMKIHWMGNFAINLRSFLENQGYKYFIIHYQEVQLKILKVIRRIRRHRIRERGFNKLKKTCKERWKSHDIKEICAANDEVKTSSRKRSS